MVGPGNAKKYPYNVMIKGLSAEKFYLPNGTGGYEEVTATPDELNTLNLLSRKYTVYSADALNAGDLLHITGYDASDDVFSVEKADADTSGKQAQLIATEANEGATTSEAADTYELLDLNTNSATVGDPVYLDATTAGNWTLSKPTGADQIAQIVGRVKVKSTDAGKIAFNVVKTEIVAFGSSALQPASVLKTKLAGGFSKVTIADGTASATDVTVSGMAVGDELVSVLALATKAAITSLADRTSEYVVGAGKLVKAAGENETSNQLIIVWNDLT